MSEVHKFYIKGHEVLIDKDKVELVSQYSWHINKTNAKKGIHRDYLAIYAGLNISGKKTQIPLHRLLMNAKKGQFVDHINGNTFDNRITNLRFCTLSENSKNKKPRINSTSKYLGVSIDVNKYKVPRFRSQINKGGKVINLGSFISEIEAAKAYNEAAIKYHGEFANLNKFE